MTFAPVVTAVLLAASAHASSLTIPCAFSVGPVAFSNCTTTNFTSPGLPEMGFHLVPDIYPDPLYSGTPVVLFVSGPTYGLNGYGSPLSVSQTLTADFTVADGYRLTGVGAVGHIGDSGSIAVGEDISLNAPCSAVLSHQSGNGGCLLGSLTSGTLSITLSIRALECGGPCHGYGDVGPATVYLTVQPIHNPEPGTWLLVIGGLVAACRRGRQGRNRLR